MMNCVEVENASRLPAQLRVGVIYFLMDEGAMIVNHGGGRVVTYGQTKDTEGLPDTGYWPISQGGTGATTQAGARSNLGALGATEPSMSTKKLETPRQISFYGAATGSTLFDGTGNVQVLLTHDPTEDDHFEQITNKVDEIRGDNFADHTHYPSEIAVRKELAKYPLKDEVSQNYKGVFVDDVALKTAWPTAKAGDTATVQSTDTTWAWNNANPVGWYDTTKIIGVGIQSVNGVMGEVIVLDVEADLGGVSMATMQAEHDEMQALKQDKLTGFAADAINAKAGSASTENPFILKSELPPDLTSQLATTDNKVTQNTEAIAALAQTQGSARVILSNMDFTRELTGDTVVDKGQLVDMQELNLAINRTLARDRKGTLALVTAINDPLVTFTTVTTSVAGEIPVLLGNVPTLGGRPSTQDQSMLVFKRNAAVGDRCRILNDERYDGATTEGYVTEVAEDGALTWGNDIEINTSDYQMQTTSQMAGMIPTCGSEPGTWGAPVNPTNFYQRWQMDLYLGKGALEKVTDYLLIDTMRDAAVWPGRTGEKLVIIGGISTWLDADITSPVATVPAIKIRYNSFSAGDWAGWAEHTEAIELNVNRGYTVNTLFTTPLTLNSQTQFELANKAVNPVGNIRLTLYGYIVPIPVPQA
jgi:hypothetical protein